MNPQRLVMGQWFFVKSINYLWIAGKLLPRGGSDAKDCCGTCVHVDVGELCDDEGLRE